MKVTVEFSTLNSTYESIITYLGKHANCDQVIYHTRKKDYHLSCNKNISFENLYFEFYKVGDPVSVNSYEDERLMIYKYLIITGPTKQEIISFIQKAKDYYKSLYKEYDTNENEIAVMTYNGSWQFIHKMKKRKNLYLPDDTFDRVISDINLFYSSEEDYTSLDIPWSRTYMLHGVPGTGKTSLIYTVASTLNKHIGLLELSEKDLTDARLREVLQEVPDNTILCLEDVDALFNETRDNKNHNTVTFSGFLNILDGIVQNKGLVIFMTTNYLKKIDDAALKRRVDYYLKFDFMKSDQVINMFKKFYPKQDPYVFQKAVSKLNLTPCILQKFFVRHLRSDDIMSHMDELLNIIEDYKVSGVNENMYT
jgi:SpoVK/Ycf46/Vps4 family AAA+-type ATPase